MTKKVGDLFDDVGNRAMLKKLKHELYKDLTVDTDPDVSLAGLRNATNLFRGAILGKVKVMLAQDEQGNRYEILALEKVDAGPLVQFEPIAVLLTKEDTFALSPVHALSSKEIRLLKETLDGRTDEG